MHAGPLGSSARDSSLVPCQSGKRSVDGTRLLAFVVLEQIGALSADSGFRLIEGALERGLLPVTDDGTRGRGLASIALDVGTKLFVGLPRGFSISRWHVRGNDSGRLERHLGLELGVAHELEPIHV